MSCIVYQIDKKTGAKYAYESFSYWDKEKKQPRSKRKYIGVVDPQTGEIVPSTKRQPRAQSGEKSSTSLYDTRLDKMKHELSKKDAKISSLQNELKELSARYAKVCKALEKISTLVGEAVV